MRTDLVQRASFVILLAAAACGSSSHGFDAGDSGADGNPGSSSTGPSGIVTLQQIVQEMSGAPTYDGTVSAAFFATPPSAANGCTTTVSGACKAVICDANDGGVPLPTGTTSAGTIGVTGTALPVSLSPDPDGTYEPFSSSSTAGPFLPPNATFEVTAPGAAVPAFKASLAFGGDVTVTSPVLSVLPPTMLPSGDVPFTWSGASATDHLQVLFSANAASGPSQTSNVTCVFTGGTGTVPARIMATMSNFGSIVVGPYASTTVTAGSYDVTVVAQAMNTLATFSK